MKKLIKSKLFLQVIVASMVATLATVGIVAATTSTIGADITTTGTLAVTGLTTATGGLTSVATTTLSGRIQGASPLVFDGVTANDGVNKLTIAVTDPTGAMTITFPNNNGTVALIENPTFTGTVGVTGTLGVTATSTIATSAGRFLVGTSTPSDYNLKTEIFKTGTTTLSIDSNVGSCIKMKTVAGAFVYCTVTGTTFSCSAATCQ